MRCYSWHRSVLIPALLLKYLYGKFPLESPEAKLELYTKDHFHVLFFFPKYWIFFFFLFLILNWEAIWVKTNKENLEVRAARVVSSQWVTLPTATPFWCSFILLPVRGRIQAESGRLMSSVIIVVTVRKGMMNWNFTGVGSLSSLFWTETQGKSLFKRCEFLIPCRSGKTEQLPPKNLKRAVFIAVSLNSCAWLSALFLVQVLAT